MHLPIRHLLQPLLDDFDARRAAACGTFGVDHVDETPVDHPADFDFFGHEGSGGALDRANLLGELGELEAVLGAHRNVAGLPAGKTGLRDAGTAGDFRLAEAGGAQPLDEFGDLHEAPSYASTHNSAMPYRIIRPRIVPPMDPRDFFLELLKRRGLSPNGLAKVLQDSGRVGVNLQSSFARWLKNPTQMPDVTTLLPVAEFFDVSLDAFYRPKVARAELRRLNGLGRAAEAVTDVTPIPAPFDQARFNDLPLQQRQDIAQITAYIVDAFTRYNDPRTNGVKGEWRGKRPPDERQSAEGPRTQRAAQPKKRKDGDA